MVDLLSVLVANPPTASKNCRCPRRYARGIWITPFLLRSLWSGRSQPPLRLLLLPSDSPRATGGSRRDEPREQLQRPQSDSAGRGSDVPERVLPSCRQVRRSSNRQLAPRRRHGGVLTWFLGKCPAHPPIRSPEPARRNVSHHLAVRWP